VAKQDKTTEAVYRQRVLEDYARDQPEPIQVDEWFAAEALKLQWPEKNVRKVIANQIDQLEVAAGQRTLSIAQRIANLNGVTQAEALKTLRAGLNATKLIVKGDPENGYTKFEHPDWPSRLDAVHEALAVHGAYAPTKSEITGTFTHQLEQLSDTELHGKISEFIELVRAHQSNARRSDTGVDGAESPGGRLLLDDGVHENEGRAEPTRSVQAVPEETIPA